MDTLYSSNDLAEKLGISVSTVRKYEQDYNLEIMRNESNNRVYTEKDVEIFKKIIELKNEGANIHLIRKILANEGIVETVPEVLDTIPLHTESIEAFKADVINQIADIVSEKERVLKEEFEKQLDEKLQHQEQRIREQIQAENKKLMDYIATTKENEKNKGFWSRIFGK
ncbi:MerR family transcriptional regulator [Anaerophilus nitritogenes]|uniref:MerR family transcriptional regulator n=1 Tax=Anaerophilus nitritogenes TaxID=2498136 RepID=UPI00101C2D43|nr:MerR family transcriptional regulator [Anaerophilus nitritogenes]